MVQYIVLNINLDRERVGKETGLLTFFVVFFHSEWKVIFTATWRTVELSMSLVSIMLGFLRKIGPVSSCFEHLNRM